MLVSFEFQDPSSGEALRLGTYAPSHPAGTPLQWALNESQGVGPFLTAGEPALLVANLSRVSNVAYDFDLYVNPPTGPGALPPATPSASFAYGGDYDTLYRVILVTQHEGLQSGFDEIRVGRSFASVSSAITAVPEPAETLRRHHRPPGFRRPSRPGPEPVPRAAAGPRVARNETRPVA